jgi:hypothetical protein
MVNCICINDKDFPSEIPLNKRPKLNSEYTIVKMDKLLGFNNIMGVQLAEISLEDCAPYLYFAASRFTPIVPLEPIKDEILEEIEI